VRDIYSGNASSKGLLIKVIVDARISPAVFVDPLRLRQILNNFVSNALKFTSKGAIEVKAELIQRGDGEDKVRFSVKDTGIGISAENQQRLFQPFSHPPLWRHGSRACDLSATRRHHGRLDRDGERARQGDDDDSHLVAAHRRPEGSFESRPGTSARFAQYHYENAPHGA
jgi:hypothetical protein